MNESPLGLVLACAKGLGSAQAGVVALLKLLGRVERTVGTHGGVEHLRKIAPGRVLAPTEHGHFVLQRPERCSANLGAAVTPRFGGRVWAPVCSTVQEVQPWPSRWVCLPARSLPLLAPQPTYQPATRGWFSATSSNQDCKREGQGRQGYEAKAYGQRSELTR